MSALLDGLARLVTGRRSAPWVIVGWVVVLAVAVPLAGGLGAAQRNDPVNYLLAGAQSAASLRELASRPGGNTSAAVIVYAHPGGLTPGDEVRINADRNAVSGRVSHAGQPGPVQRACDGAAATAESSRR